MSKKSKKQSSGLSAPSRFVDAFFKAVSDNTADRMIAKAKKERLKREALEKIEKEKREKEELEDILATIPKTKIKSQS